MEGHQRTPKEQLSYRISAKPDPLALDKHKRLFPLVDILERASRLAPYRFSPGRCHPEFVARAYGLLTHRPIIGLAMAGIRKFPWTFEGVNILSSATSTEAKGVGLAALVRRSVVHSALPSPSKERIRLTGGHQVHQHIPTALRASVESALL